MKLIIDASIIIHSNYHIRKKFLTGDLTQPVIDGTVTNIENIARRFPVEPEIVLALDVGESWRKTIYPDYKANRSKLNLDFDRIQKALIERFTCYFREGLEADDICFLLSRKEPKSILVSDDKDFYLMLDDARQLFRHKQTAGLDFTMLSDYDVFITALNKVCSGDNSDNVPRIKLKNFGEVKLRKWFEPTHPYNEQQLFRPNRKHLIAALDILRRDGYISDYETNYRLVVYDMENYPKDLDLKFD